MHRVCAGCLTAKQGRPWSGQLLLGSSTDLSRHSSGISAAWAWTSTQTSTTTRSSESPKPRRSRRSRKPTTPLPRSTTLTRTTARPSRNSKRFRMLTRCCPMPARRNNTTTSGSTRAPSRAPNQISQASPTHSKAQTTATPKPNTRRAASTAATGGGRATNKRTRSTPATRIARMQTATSNTSGTEETTPRPSAEPERCSRSSSGNSSSITSKCTATSRPDRMASSRILTARTRLIRSLLGRQPPSKPSSSSLASWHFRFASLFSGNFYRIEPDSGKTACRTT